MSGVTLTFKKWTKRKTQGTTQSLGDCGKNSPRSHVQAREGQDGEKGQPTQIHEGKTVTG